MADKIGVYICEGCDIGSNLDCAALATDVKNKFGNICPVIETVPVLCSGEGVAQIQADVDAGKVNAVSICACSPRAKWDVFQFGEKALVGRVNLREGCVWSTEADGDEVQLMAKDYVLMGVRQMEKSGFPEPEVPDMKKTILVVGGGFTGLTAALDAAKAGQDVVLVEKNPELGGAAKNLYKTVPLAPPYTTATDTGIEALVAAVESHAKITVYKGATLAALKGAPGQYEAVIAAEGGEKTEGVGAVILATGWVGQDMSVYEPYGFGTIKNVISSKDMELMAKSGSLLRPSDGKPVSAVAFVMQPPAPVFGEADLNPEACAPAAPAAEAEAKEGEEEPAYVHKDLESAKHLAYSSGLSPAIALKQAGYVRELAPNSLAFVIYEHMNTPGIFELYYKAAQDDPGIMLTKGQIQSVAEDADGSVLITVGNSLLGADFEVKVDLLVLSLGMVPSTAKEPVMNFEYRQGPAFPDLDLFDGFADSNYICFPYETRRTGVYAAGNVRQPMFMDQCADDAAGAALKAIQCVTCASHGVAVHPRSGDRTYPKFNFVRCTQCKRCTEECPFGALDDDEKGTPKPNPTRCRRCGTCMGACPERVISFDTYNVDQVGSMIKEVKVPENMDEGGPRVIILACENDAYPAMDMAAFRKLKWNQYVRVIPVRCLGSVNAIWVADAMSKGVDGVMMLGCKYGDDYQCHFVKGSEICNRRKENIAETLNRLGVEPDRVEQYQVSIDEYDKVPELIEDFMTMIMSKGPNPFKGY